VYWNSGKSSYQSSGLRREWSLGMKDHSFGAKVVLCASDEQWVKQIRN
jgi:hypothetical protein